MFETSGIPNGSTLGVFSLAKVRKRRDDLHLHDVDFLRTPTFLQICHWSFLSMYPSQLVKTRAGPTEFPWTQRGVWNRELSN